MITPALLLLALQEVQDPASRPLSRPLSQPLSQALSQPHADPGLFASLGWFDITALAILLLFFVLGLFRGFIWQLSRIVTLVLAYVAAGAWGPRLRDATLNWYSVNTQETELPLYVAYFGIFLGVLIAISVIAHFLEKLITKSGLSFYNRLGGGVLGVATGAAVVLALLSGVFMFFGSEGNVAQAARSSKSLEYGRHVIDFLGDLVPQKVRQVFQPDASKQQGPPKQSKPPK